MEYWVRKIIRNLNRIEHLYAEKYPLPYLSVLTEDCIGSRKDVMAGGARYTGVGFNLGGIGTAVDALAAIRDVVYDKNMVTLRSVWRYWMMILKMQSRFSDICQRVHRNTVMIRAENGMLIG